MTLEFRNTPRSRAPGSPRARMPFALAALVFAAALAAHAQEASPEQPSSWSGKAPVASRSFMVAAANPLAVEAGYRILRQGGSAVDAAIAVQLVLNLVEPQSSGIGGGAFMLVHDARTRTLVAYDGRETAPAAARPDRFLDADGKPMRFMEAVVGGRSVGVPGVVALLGAAHRAHGRLPWRAAVRAGDRARRARIHDLAAARRADRGRALALRAGPRARATSSSPTAARAPRERRSATPRSRKRCGRSPRTVPARSIAGRSRATSSTPRTDSPRIRAISRSRISRATACRCASPCAARIVRTRSAGCRCRRPAVRPCSRCSASSSRGTSQRWAPRRSGASISQAKRNGSRSPIAPRSWRIRISSRRRPGCSIAAIFARARRAFASTGASGGRHPAYPRSRRPPARRRGACTRRSSLPATTHLSIVDGAGNAVAMTSSIEWAFGSHLLTEGGFLLNNELTDFSFAPEVDGAPVANRVEAGKRPRSSMAPTIVYDRAGRIYMVAGSGGRPGDRQSRRQDAARRARLAARPAGGDRAAELRQPQRADRAGSGNGRRRARTAARARSATS